MVEQLTKQEPQELRFIDDGEESKSSGNQLMDASMASRQPQSLILRESPLAPDQSLLRALQSQLAHLRIENEGMRRQLGRERRGDQRMPNELKWLIYFRAPTVSQLVHESERAGSASICDQKRLLKAQVLAIVHAGLEALFQKDPSFRGNECATFWVAQEFTDWEAFRIDYVGFKIAAFRAAMKAALANEKLLMSTVRTTQPSSVSLYRQLPKDPPLFSGRLDELAATLPNDMNRVFLM